MSSIENHSEWKRSLSCHTTYIAFGRYRREMRIIPCGGVCLRRALPVHYPLASERISQSRVKRRDRWIWQRRFWAHLLTSQEDFNVHFDFIERNPAKHGWVRQVADWSFHHFVELGIYPMNWGHSGDFNIQANEYLE